MRTRTRCGAGVAVVAVLTMLAAGGPAAAPAPTSTQPPDADAPAPAAPAASSSSDLAEQLAAAMEGAELDSLAAKDSDGDDRYVAVLRFPTMMLVVSARYEVPIYVEEKLAAGSHREVYMDLNTASIVGTKVLITDIGADGLREGDAGDSADVGGELMRFAESSPQHEAANATYARMLQALLNAVR